MGSDELCPYYSLLLTQTQLCSNICVLWPICSETFLICIFFLKIVYHVSWAYYYYAFGAAALAMALLKYFSRSLPELPAPDNLAIEDDKDDDDPFASCDE